MAKTDEKAESDTTHGKSHQNESLPPANGANELRQRINQAARDQLARVPGKEAASQKRHPHRYQVALWLVILATLALAGVVVQRSNQQKKAAVLTPDSLPYQAQAAGGTITSSAPVLATLVEEIPTATRSAAAAPATAGSFQSFFPLIQAALPFCQDIREIQYKIIGGPDLSPAPGTIIDEAASQTGTITWVIQNTGACAWKDISIWALTSGTTQSITIAAPAQNNSEVEFTHPINYLAPNQQAVIRLTVPADKTTDLEAEWVLQVNELFAFPAPHLSIQVKNWIRPRTARAVPTARQPLPLPAYRTPWPTAIPTVSTGISSRPTPTAPSSRP